MTTALCRHNLNEENLIVMTKNSRIMLDVALDYLEQLYGHFGEINCFNLLGGRISLVSGTYGAHVPLRSW
jgi:hypothetical protein